MGVIGSILVKLGMQTAEFDQQCTKSAQKSIEFKSSIEKSIGALHEMHKAMRMIAYLEIFKIGMDAITHSNELFNNSVNGGQAFYKWLENLGTAGKIMQSGANLGNWLATGSTVEDGIKYLEQYKETLQKINALLSESAWNSYSKQMLFGKEGAEKERTQALIDYQKKAAKANEELNAAFGNMPENEWQQKKDQLSATLVNEYNQNIKDIDEKERKDNEKKYNEHLSRLSEINKDWADETSGYSHRQREVDKLTELMDKEHLLGDARVQEYLKAIDARAKYLDNRDKEKKRIEEEISGLKELASGAEKLLSTEDQRNEKREQWKKKLGQDYDAYSGIVEKLIAPKNKQEGGEFVDMSNRWQTIQSDMFKHEDLGQITKDEFQKLRDKLDNLEVSIRGN